MSTNPIPATLVAGNQQFAITLTEGQLYDNIRLKILAASCRAKVDEALKEIAYAREHGQLRAADLDHLTNLAGKKLQRLETDDGS